MIVQSKTLAPFIDFGFGLVEKTVSAGTPVTVWQGNLYNTEYSSVINTPGGTYSKVSDYQYTVTYATPGTYNITVVVSNKDKTKNYTSNTITITVE